MKFVMVEWEDASEEDDAWVEIEGNKPMPARIFWSAGWLVRKTKTEVELTSCVERGYKGDMGRRNRIPAGMVRSIREISMSARLKL